MTIATINCSVESRECQDGHAIYNTIRDAVSAPVVISQYQGIYDEWYAPLGKYYIGRQMIHFDTSVIPVDAVISAVKVTFRRESAHNDDGDNPYIRLYEGMNTYPHSPVVAGDYNKNNYGATVLGERQYTPFWGDGIINLNAAGLLAMKLGAGAVTKFVCCMRDLNSAYTPVAENYINFTATDFDPIAVMEVTYTVPVIPQDLTTFGKRKKITLQGTVDGAQSDYPMGMKVVHNTGVDGSDTHFGNTIGKVFLNNSSQHNFNDVAYTGSDGITKLPYWRERIYNAGYTDYSKMQSWTNTCGPSSYYYNGFTYFVYQTFDIWCRKYNHATGVWSAEVYVGANPLKTDAHAFPTICVSNTGVIHIFAGSGMAGGVTKHWKSTNPEDITTWTVEANIGGTDIYASPVRINNGAIYLLLTASIGGNRGLCWYYSTDNYVSKHDLIDMGAGNVVYPIYPQYDSVSDKIHIFWTYYDGVCRKNVYHAYFTPSDGKLWSANGTDLGALPISKATADANCLVWAHATDTQTGTSSLDDSKNPHCIVNASDGATYYHRHFYWNGAAWVDTGNIVASGAYFHVGGISAITSSNIEAYLIVSGSLEKWIWNGVVWAKSKTVMDMSLYGYSLAIPEIVGNYSGTGPKWIFCEVNRTFYGTDYTTPMRCFTTNDSDVILDSGLYSIFWVKVVAIPISPNTVDIYIYYDSPLSGTVSNGYNTFSLFDGFEEGSTVWTTNIAPLNNGTFVSEQKNCVEGLKGGHFTCSAPLAHAVSTPVNVVGKELGFWVNPCNTNQDVLIALQDQAAYAGGHIFMYLVFNTTGNGIRYYDGAWRVLAATCNLWQWYYVKLRHFHVDTFKMDYDIYNDKGTLIAEVLNADSWDNLATLTHLILVDSGTTAMEGYFDSIKARKWTNNEPTYNAWGLEENLGIELYSALRRILYPRKPLGQLV